MRYLYAMVFVLTCTMAVRGQSATTESLQKKHNDALSLFFYHNTLRMLNQSENKEFDALIKDIEKMKFLMIEKGNAFVAGDYKKLVSNYKSESFEEIMSSRHEGKNFDIFVKEKNGDTKGMLVLVNDSSNLYVLDIVGKIALDKVTSLYSELGKTSDVGERIKQFTRKKEDD